MMKKLLTVILTILYISSYAQSDSASQKEEKILPENLNVTLTLQNLHFWRGVSVTDVIFTSIDTYYTFGKNKYFIFGIWGGYSWGKETQVVNTWHEVDYYLKYDTGKLMLGFWDCYNDSYTETDVAKHSVFNYDKNNTTHRVDFRGSWIVSDKTPVRLEFGTSVFGWDRSPAIRDEKGSVIAGNKNRYSSYFEVGYPVIKGKKTNLDVFCGTAFGLAGISHMYGNRKNNVDVVNVGFKASRNLKILNHSIPVGVTTMWNPSSELVRVKLEATLF